MLIELAIGLGGAAAYSDTLSAEVSRARVRVESFFEQPFPEPFDVQVFDHRADMDRALPAAWGIPETPCFAVGLGYADAIFLLHPDAWAEEACDHDPADEDATLNLVAHEITHVFHGQMNPTRDFTGAEELSWFIEGIAVLASGQLDDTRQDQARAVVTGPDSDITFGSLWSGRHRYALSGSMVAYLDHAYGRATLVALLDNTTMAETIAELGDGPDTLLDGWARWLTDSHAGAE